MPAPKQKSMTLHRNRQFTLRDVPLSKGPRFQPVPLAVSPPPLNPCPIKVSSQVPFKPFPFFDLPGEIRNRIYDLIVEKSRVLIERSHPNKELARLHQLDPTQKHKRPRSRLSGVFSKHGAGASLLHTCQQMNAEAVEFVYARTTFCFDTMNTIHKFLETIPSHGAKSIETLEVVQKGYGEPQWTDDREWKLRHDSKWKKTLSRVRENLVALQTLKLNITVFDWPCRLEMDATWAKTLINFAGTGLNQVTVVFEHDRFSWEKGCETARQLETRMMTPEGTKKKIKEVNQQVQLEKQRIALAQRKATKVLSIRLPLKTSKQSLNIIPGPARKMFKSKGLEQYARAEPLVAFCPH